MNTAGFAPRPLDFGTLLTRSLDNVRLIWWQVLVYLALVAVFALAAQLVGIRSVGGAGLLVYLVGQYWLYHALIKARGLIETPRYHLFAFAALAAMLIIPIMLGLAAFVLPGLFLVARWIAAPTFVVARGEGAIAAAGDSWQAVRGHTGKLVGALILAFVGSSLIGAITGLITGGVGELVGTGANLVTQIEVHLLPLLLLALSVATYELLGPQDSSIEEVFG